MPRVVDAVEQQMRDIDQQCHPRADRQHVAHDDAEPILPWQMRLSDLPPREAYDGQHIGSGKENIQLHLSVMTQFDQQIRPVEYQRHVK